MNSPRHHRFVISKRKSSTSWPQSTCTRSRPKFAHAQYKNSAVQKIMAFHAGGNTSCGRGMRNYHSTNSGLMTVFSSPRKLYLVVVPQNRHQRVTSAVTRLLARQAWRLAIPTTATQAAQTVASCQLVSISFPHIAAGACSVSLGMRLAIVGACRARDREILWAGPRPARPAGAWRGALASANQATSVLS